MMLWEFALVPLLVLPIVLLFRFVGCGTYIDTSIPPGPDPAPAPTPTPTPDPTPTPPVPNPNPKDLPPDYRKYILGEQPNPGAVKNAGVVPDGDAVIGYWRLVDVGADTAAKDEKGIYDGAYVSGTSLADVAATAALGGSEAASGNFVAAQPGLIASDPTKLCRYYNGGYVKVPYVDGLHTDQFTLEAWVNLTALKPNYEHVLFDTGGRFALPGLPLADRGYRVLADRDGNWQVRLASTQAVVFATPPKVPLGGRTHFALVLQNHDADGIQKDISVYIDGKLTVTQTVPAYQPPVSAPLYVAAENTAALPTQAEKMRAPFLGQIQEVVLHNKALSREEIENHVDINR